MKASSRTPKPAHCLLHDLTMEDYLHSDCHPHLVPTPQSCACSHGSWASAELRTMESLLSTAGDADRMANFIKTKKFCEPSIEISIAMDLCFSGA